MTICTHCGIEGMQVDKCDDYNSPHLCPNDHITHSRPDLFCQVCGGSLVCGVCPKCTKLLESKEYKQYHKAGVDALVKLTSEDDRPWWDGFIYFEGFLSNTSVDDEALEQATAG